MVGESHRQGASLTNSTHITSTIERQQLTNTLSMNKFRWPVGNLFVGLALHNANRHTTINGPAITVPPMQAKLADPRPSCRNVILEAINQLHQRTGATQFARRDIVAEVQAADRSFERQTIYRCIRRMTGHEPGSAHQDLEDLGSDQLRLRGD